MTFLFGKGLPKTGKPLSKQESGFQNRKMLFVKGICRCKVVLGRNELITVNAGHELLSCI
jgi:hypothetical protein